MWFKDIPVVEIPVSNIDRACNWYITRLEATIDFRGDWVAEIHLPGTVRTGLYLVETKDAYRLKFDTANGQHAVVHFRSFDVVKDHAELASRNVAVTQLERLDGVPIQFYFHDCDGNYFCVSTDLDCVD